MTTVAENHSSLDPSRSAKIPVTLSSGLKNSSAAPAQRHASIQWNFKPRLQQDCVSKIHNSRQSSASHISLTIRDPSASGEYRYSGTQQPSESCALIYNPSTKSLVLEKLDADFTFNLQTSPANHDRARVTSQYPQLDIGMSDAESDAGSVNETFAADGIDTTEADANNPYDYRHFLKRRRTSSPEAPVVRPSVSPAVLPQRLSRPNPKPKPRPRQTQRPRKPTREAPKANSEDSDDGGLTIDMGDSPGPGRFRSGAVVFNHDKRNGPISLRSAASSMSPASIRQDSGNEEGESDSDVEHLKLPSPQRRPHAEEEEGDDEDDLEAELRQAMENDDEDEEGQEEEEEDAEADASAQGQQQRIRKTIEDSSSSSEEE